MDLSEGYTIGGDTLQIVQHSIWAGQTFRVTTPISLQFLDINMNPHQSYPTAYFQIFLADAYHHPFGPELSSEIYYLPLTRSPFVTQRVRLKMQPLLLLPSRYYFLLCTAYPPLLAFSPYWQYDNFNATYPAGHRLLSEDAGQNWTLHVGDDHIFVLWGIPPPPDPEPPPPVDNLAAIDLHYHPTLTGYNIRVITNVPCHLYMYHTTTEPQKQPRTLYKRGIPTVDALNWCFVNFHENEQVEEGDTILHTFLKPNWPT